MKQGLVSHNETFLLRDLHESYKPASLFSGPPDIDYGRQKQWAMALYPRTRLINCSLSVHQILRLPSINRVHVCGP